MSFHVIIFAVALPFLATAASAPQWVAATVGEVEIWTDVAPGLAGQILAETHSFYSACARLRGLPASPGSLKIIYFSREAGYRRLQPGEASHGFYHRSGEGERIVVHGGPGAVRRLRHELVHVMNGRAGYSFVPIWLNEGLAEYYSALDVSPAASGPVRVEPVAGLARLAAGRPFGEADLAVSRVAADPALFYARAWALVRQLAADAGHAGLERFAALLRDGGSETRAFLDVFGASKSEMLGRTDRVLVRAASRNAWRDRDWPAAPNVAARPVRREQIEAELDEMARSMGLASRSEQRRNAALQAAGRGPDEYSRPAMDELRRGNLETALSLMEKAVSHGIRDARMWFEYAMLLRETGHDRRDWLDALRNALELDPQHGGGWFILGVSTTGAESLSALERAAKDPLAKSWAWEAYARALFRAGLLDQARTAVREALQTASGASGKSMALGLLEELDAQPPAPPAQPGPVVTPRGWSGPKAAAFVAGWLAAAECGAAAPVLVIESASGRVRVSVKRPGHVQVKGTGEFACGEQKPQRRVVAGHDALPDAALGTVGDLVSLEYN